MVDVWPYWLRGIPARLALALIGDVDRVQVLIRTANGWLFLNDGYLARKEWELTTHSLLVEGPVYPDNYVEEGNQIRAVIHGLLVQRRWLSDIAEDLAVLRVYAVVLRRTRSIFLLGVAAAAVVENIALGGNVEPGALARLLWILRAVYVRF